MSDLASLGGMIVKHVYLVHTWFKTNVNNPNKIVTLLQEDSQFENILYTF